MIITQALSDQQLKDTRIIFREYYEELLKIDLCFKDFEQELVDLPGDYAPPDGALLLAGNDTTVAGCVALKKVTGSLCEMKRLYVRPDYRGQGLGRLLAGEIIDAARKKGYGKMRLDTLTWLKQAIALYKSLGFQQISPYLQETPVELLYWELDLNNYN